MLRNSGRPAQLQHRIHGKRGHLSNQAAIELLPKIIGPATRHLILAHLSDECNRPELVEKGVRACLAAIDRPDVTYWVAHQDCVAEPVVVGSS